MPKICASGPTVSTSGSRSASQRLHSKGHIRAIGKAHLVRPMKAAAGYLPVSGSSYRTLGYRSFREILFAE